MPRQSFVQDPRTGKLVPKDEYYAARPRTHMIIPDTPDYESPIDGSVISGRKQRREDLKRNGCHEYDPGERKDFIQRKDAEYRDQARMIEHSLRGRFA